MTSRVGATVQGNGKPPAFFCEILEDSHDGRCRIYHRCWSHPTGDLHSDNLPGGEIQCLNDKDLMAAYRCIPNRCKEHSRELKRWQLSQEWKKKLRKKFNRRRHHHIKMVTVGLPGSKIVDCDRVDESIKSFRQQITYELYKLRKRPIWKEHVDGGLWFFECTIDIKEEGKVKVNPHLHLVLLCPKMFPVTRINEYVECLSGIGLGRFHVSTPRHADGESEIVSR